MRYEVLRIDLGIVEGYTEVCFDTTHLSFQESQMGKTNKKKKAPKKQSGKKDKGGY